jgi:hypothetical protein
MIAASSQIRSTERRDGVSRAEVVMDDIAIGNPVSLSGPAKRFGPLPGIHIAQFHCQVIANCGVISRAAVQTAGNCSPFWGHRALVP